VEALAAEHTAAHQSTSRTSFTTWGTCCKFTGTLRRVHHAVILGAEQHDVLDKGVAFRPTPENSSLRMAALGPQTALVRA